MNQVNIHLDYLEDYINLQTMNAAKKLNENLFWFFLSDR